MLTIQADQRQADVLACIVDSIRRNGRPPTVREICDATGISSTSVVDYHLWSLERAGKIQREPEIARGIWPVLDDGTFPFCAGSGRMATGSVTPVGRGAE